MTIDFKALAAPFPAEDIEWRIGQAGKKNNGQIWATCLAYVQARAIMNRLDEVCGPGGWKVDYRFVPASQGIEAGVICQLSIKVNGEWITKEDGAEQTDIESFKGGISAALKRAGSVWGIGRYLYGLDSGFAQIVTDKKGANYGQLKDKTPFYWLPPNLPAWALPAGAKVKSNGIRPEQPGEEDGHGPSRGYRVPEGGWKNYTIEQIYRDHGPKEIARYLDTLEKRYDPLQPWMVEFKHVAETYCAMMEQMGDPSPGSLPESMRRA